MEAAKDLFGKKKNRGIVIVFSTQKLIEDTTFKCPDEQATAILNGLFSLFSF